MAGRRSKAKIAYDAAFEEAVEDGKSEAEAAEIGTAAQKVVEEEAKIKRVAFNETEEAKAILNDKGKLTALPTGNGFDTKLHLKPGREDYASDETFYLFRAEEMEASANAALEKATKYRKIAKDIKKYGNPDDRKKVAQLDRMASKIGALMAELKEQGVEVDMADLFDTDDEDEAGPDKDEAGPDKDE